MFKLPTLTSKSNLKTSMNFNVKMKKNEKQECERRWAGSARKNMTGRVCICEEFENFSRNIALIIPFGGFPKYVYKLLKDVFSKKVNFFPKISKKIVFSPKKT